jgi:hypothetical protein
VCLGDAFDQRVNCCAIGDVAWSNLARTACGSNRCVDGGEAIGGSRDKHDMAAVAREAFCDGAADAATCSGDDSDALLDDVGLQTSRDAMWAGILVEAAHDVRARGASLRARGVENETGRLRMRAA